MFYYDYVSFMDYKFYITIKDDYLYSLNLDLPDVNKYIYNEEKLLKYTNWLKDYFKGIITTHDFKFNPSSASFNNIVFNELIKIPPGSVTTYKELSHAISKPNAARAVGNALSKNEILILIPCHRVIKSDGSLGGYAEGPILKKILLEIEKNVVSK